MSHIFPKWVNRLPLIVALFATGGAVSAVGFVWYYFSPYFLDVGYRPEQPVPYSHRLHVGAMGMDCRYCHTPVETSFKASIPPTQTCMNCHSNVNPNSPRLAPVQQSWATDTPIQWVRVHQLPDYVHFDHSSHVNAGVGCVSCHGRVDHMDVVQQVEPLSMSWCLDCHRDPAPHIRPPAEVTNMNYIPKEGEGELLVRTNNIRPPENCSACHY